MHIRWCWNFSYQMPYCKILVYMSLSSFLIYLSVEVTSVFSTNQFPFLHLLLHPLIVSCLTLHVLAYKYDIIYVSGYITNLYLFSSSSAVPILSIFDTFLFHHYYLFFSTECSFCVYVNLGMYVHSWEPTIGCMVMK